MSKRFGRKQKRKLKAQLIYSQLETMMIVTLNETILASIKSQKFAQGGFVQGQAVVNTK
jgi:hypothetical protein